MEKHTNITRQLGKTQTNRKCEKHTNIKQQVGVTEKLEKHTNIEKIPTVKVVEKNTQTLTNREKHTKLTWRKHTNINRKVEKLEKHTNINREGGKTHKH